VQGALKCALRRALLSFLFCSREFVGSDCDTMYCLVFACFQGLRAVRLTAPLRMCIICCATQVLVERRGQAGVPRCCYSKGHWDCDRQYWISRSGRHGAAVLAGGQRSATHTHTHTRTHTRARAFFVSGGVVVIISSLTRLSHAHCFLSQNMSGCVRVWPLPRCSLAWVPMDVTGERSASKASLARPRYERRCAGHRHPNVR
jgi:hypothetical protein